VSNYVRATSVLRRAHRATGASVQDELTGQSFEIVARTVVNAAGPWVGELCGSLNGASSLRWMKSVVLLTRSVTASGVALGVPSRHPRSQNPGLLFLTPWKGYSMVGALTVPYAGSADACAASREEISQLLDEVNSAYSEATLSPRDVLGARVGLVPADSDGRSASRRFRIIDHRAEGLEGLYSVIGVKSTTARDVAERMVSRVCAKLGRSSGPSPSRATPVWGGRIRSVDALTTRAVRESAGLVDEASARRLAETYGTEYARLLGLIREQPAWGAPVAGSCETLKAEVVHAVREEMAVRLSDVVFRRTTLGAISAPADETLRACALLMAALLDWDGRRIDADIAQARAWAQRRLPPGSAA
jgi:glycerol-3-phosphate dehydrogenase